MTKMYVVPHLVNTFTGAVGVTAVDCDCGAILQESGLVICAECCEGDGVMSLGLDPDEENDRDVGGHLSGGKAGLL